MHADAIDRVFELMLVLETADDAEVRAEQLDREVVSAVERERRLCEDAAHRADWQAFDVNVLRRVLTDAERLARRPAARVADRQRADLARRRQVPLEQHGRNAQRVGDVVEAVCRIVWRKQRGRIDVEREQVADGVGILGAIQPMHERTAGIWMQRA